LSVFFTIFVYFINKTNSKQHNKLILKIKNTWHINCFTMVNMKEFKNIFLNIFISIFIIVRNIMKKYIYKLATFVALIIASNNASALVMPDIEGQIDFGGVSTVTVVGGQVTQIDFSSMLVVLSSGDFSGLSIVDPVTFATPFDPSMPTLGLWAVGGFSFDYMTMTHNIVNGAGTSLAGTGVIKHAGFADTMGTWHFTSQASGNGTFGFSATTVPEPATLAILGLGLVGFGAARRRKQAQK